jgi:prephenate dehydrogenase
MQWQKVTLIGVGLLGGSIGLALKHRSLAAQVHGYVRRPGSIGECMEAGAVDFATTDLQEAVEGADLIVFCTPIAQMRSLAEKLGAGWKPGCVVTDVGSVKGSVVRDLEPVITRAGGHFIGSHPMAGAEKMGVSSARPDLFAGNVCVVTPTPRSHSPALEEVVSFWKTLGARMILLPPDLHDEFVARSSHLPHVIAAELANYVLSPVHPKQQTALCAAGFRDTTRIASGSPEMWRDIALANRKNLAGVLSVFIEDLNEFQLALQNEDAAAVQQFFEQARERREKWHEESSSSSPE